MMARTVKLVITVIIAILIEVIQRCATSGLGSQSLARRSSPLCSFSRASQNEWLPKPSTTCLAQVHRLLTTYLNRYPLHPLMSIDDVQHWLLPRPGVIDSFVVESEGKITDFTSFYTLPSSILNHPTENNTLMAAY